ECGEENRLEGYDESQKAEWNGSKWGIGRMVLAAIHSANQATCNHTKLIEPQNRVMPLAIRSAVVWFFFSARSSSAIDFTFWAVSSSTVEGWGSFFGLGVRRVIAHESLREGLADGKTRRKCGSTTSAKQGPASMYQSMTDALIVLNH